IRSKEKFEMMVTDYKREITSILDEWEVPYSLHVASAHKVPEKVIEIVNKYNAESDPICYITIAGRSNGLSGVVAASSVHPVIACPPFQSKEDMMINVNSSLQMPSDTPVMTLIDPQNAAMAVIRILANSDANLRKKVEGHIVKIKAKF
ncbi:AIR carboxylase family protein, partial [Patescibacteria group bacterium]|nr:AIR carboxylase family protein [Patescibacteria group bacterium]